MDQHVADSATAPPPIGQLYTTEEVARFLRVTQRAVQVWIKRGELTAIRYGRLLRVRQADLATFGEVLNQRPAAPRTDASPMPETAAASAQE
jgi:excisionase family DNA binding protein